MAEMTAAQRNAFLRQTRIAKLATLNSDGSPNVVPVWFEWDGQTAIVFTERHSPKVKRIRADSRVALSVEEPLGIPEAWVTIEGTAAIEDHGGIDLARRLAPRYYTPERAAEALEKWEPLADSWVILRITPTRIRSS
jgi:PPOX class probable F420-dependent enzyme